MQSMSRPTPELFARLPEQYFTRIVGAAAAARELPGPRLIDLGRGNPDLPPPPVALDALRAALDEAHGMHGYPPFQGRAELREAIAARYLADHGVELDPDREIAVVPGTKTAIMLAVLACAGAGDAVALPDPGYPDYLSAVAFAGARIVALPLDGGTSWQPDFDALGGERPALAVLNYPSNPCAACEAPGTFEAAVAWAHERGAWLLNDLAYGFLTFDGRRARSVLEIEGAREVAVELWSPSKIYGMAGWRIGFAVGNAEVVGRVRELLDHLVAGVPVALQYGLVAALSGDQGHVRSRFDVYRRRRDVLVSGLGLAPPPEGTFYAWWRLPDGLTAEGLLASHRVAVAPGAGFGARGAGYARLSLAVDDADLEEGVARLAAAVGG
jgi:aminotransferase